VLLASCDCADGEVPATVYDWKDLPGGNQRYIQVDHHQGYD